MRASLYLVGFAVASLAGAGIVEVGCSSSSSPATTSPEASTTTDSGGDEDVDAAAAPCTAAPVNAATFDAGSPIWSCLQAACATSLGACGTDCPCNDAVLAALLCQADGGSSMACFTPVAEVDTSGLGVIQCLENATSGCGLTLDGGGDSGTTSDAGTSDAGTTSDAATSDGATEAAP